MGIGERIKYYRQINNISRQELATKFEISIHTLAKYEQGQREPSIDMITMLSDYFNVSIDELIKGETKNSNNSSNKDELISNLIKENEELKKYINRIKNVVLGE